MARFAIQRLAIVGVGLIGASVGMAVRSRKIAQHVVGVGRRTSVLELAKNLGAIDSIAVDLQSAVADADMAIVCTPVDGIADQVDSIAKCVATERRGPAGILITDAGSTKSGIVRDIRAASAAWPASARFVGSHPLAGSEKSGPEHASADLFVGRTVVVSPDIASAKADIESVSEFWRCLQARVVLLSPEEHDRAVAMTSHLPHVAASAIASLTPEEYVTLTAGGWLDTTRIAAGDPALWRQIALSNRENLLAAVAALERSLAAWKEALAAADGPRIEQLLAEGKRIRDAVGS